MRLGQKLTGAWNATKKFGVKSVNSIGRFGRKHAPSISNMTGLLSAGLAGGAMILAATGVGIPAAGLLEAGSLGVGALGALEAGAAVAGGVSTGAQLLTAGSCYSQYRHIKDAKKRERRKNLCEAGQSRR